MDYFTLFGKVIRKLHLGKIIYKLLRPFAHDIIGNEENYIRTARKLLNNISVNPTKSCLYVHKELVYRYDLQVIIPTYNTGKYIERCVDSVLSLPSSRSMIVTVVNDGSQDCTGDVLRKYDKDQRVEIIT